MNRSEKSDKVMAEFAEKLIHRLETMKSEGWQKGWISTQSHGLPQNINGRPYGGMNSFFLFLHTAENNYRTPVYVTFNQLKDINKQIFKGEMVGDFIPKGKWDESAHLLKGAQAEKIIFWDIRYRYENNENNGKGRNIPEAKANELNLKHKSKEELKDMGIESYAVLNWHPVFNIDQTTIKDVLPKKYEEIIRRFEPPVMKDDTGMYKSPAIDRMLEKQEWQCPIKYDKPSSEAFYSPLSDSITVPMKAQFAIHEDKDGKYHDGMEYYSTLIHEMAHSTGHPDRLNRTKDSYGREELVAEMTATVIGSSMGFDTKSVIKNNEEYLSGWIDQLKEKPEFIRTIIGDVSKATNAIISEIDRQNIALGLKPLLGREEEKKPEEKKAVTVDLKDSTSQDLFKFFSKLREKHPDAMFLFRNREQYSLFFEDAQKAAHIIGLKVSQDKVAKGGDGISPAPVASFPTDQLDKNLPKLIRAGERIAIVDMPEKARVQEKVQESQSKKTDSLPVALDEKHTLDKFLVFRGYNNTMKLTVSVDGEALLPKSISTKDYIQLDRGKISNRDLTLKYFSDEIKGLDSKLSATRSKSMSR